MDEMDFASVLRRRVGKEAPKLQKLKVQFYELALDGSGTPCRLPAAKPECLLRSRYKANNVRTCSWSQSSRSLANMVDGKRLR